MINSTREWDWMDENKLTDNNIKKNNKNSQMGRLKKYNQNLRVEDNKVQSYNTLVAEISGDIIKKVNWSVGGKTSSPTTTKHINYVAEELNLIKK